MIANTYPVKISKVNYFFKKISLAFILVAAVGWVLFDIVDFPVKYLYHLSFAYHSALPEKLSSFLEFSVIAGLLGAILFTSRTYTKAQLSITDEYIQITSQKKGINISTIELKRIVLIQKTFSFRPYRMEFVCPNNGTICIVFTSKDHIETAISLLLQIVPDKINSEVMFIENDDYY